MSAIRWYIDLWRECFGAGDDLLARFFVRLELICLHIAIIWALLMVVAFTR